MIHVEGTAVGASSMHQVWHTLWWTCILRKLFMALKPLRLVTAGCTGSVLLCTSAATGEAMAEIMLDGSATTTDISGLDPARFVGRRGRLWG